MIENLKDLQKIIALCRKQGVTHIKIGDLELNLGSMPPKPSKPVDYSNDFPEANIQVPQYEEYSAPDTLDTKAIADKIATSELTEEQLLFYSAQGHVEQWSY